MADSTQPNLTRATKIWPSLTWVQNFDPDLSLQQTLEINKQLFQGELDQDDFVPFTNVEGTKSRGGKVVWSWNSIPATRVHEKNPLSVP